MPAGGILIERSYSNARPDARLLAHPALTFGVRKSFDGIPKCGTRHGGRVLLQEGAESGGADALAELAEHPADGLVDQIVLVIEQAHSDSQRIVRGALLDVVERGN